MKAIVVVLALALVQGSLGLKKGLAIEDQVRNIIENQIEEALNCIQETLINGDENLGIPSISPLVIDEGDTDLSDLGIEGLSGILKVENFVIEGIPLWNLEHLKADVTVIPAGAKVEITLKWDVNSLYGNYEGDLNIFGTNIRGVGYIDAKQTGFTIAVKLQATLSRISLKKLSIRPSLETLSVTATQIEVNGQEISEEISEIAAKFPQYLEENIDAIDKFLSDLIMNLVNKKSYGLGEVIQGLLDKCI